MKENDYQKISPFTGGKVVLIESESTVTFRGEKITAPRKFYRCLDTGHEFTDDKVDNDFIWAVFREYCKKHYATFTEIIEHEIPDLIEKKLNDDQEIYEFLHENYYYNHDYDGFQSQENHPCMDREDMLEFARHLKK